MRLLLLLLLAAPAPLAAQPACGAETRGQLACMAGRSCLCRHEQGGSLTGIPPGWAWDCGALRPDCPPPAAAKQAAPNLFLGPLSRPQRSPAR
ncbi:hypothetical protein C8P66_13149 [Humitalea rosea]|uniref:Uncharacterized protein n=1 Tax=Humitalea rosea TaxID=990373 RepID=A0A2W7HWI2_9PROT|nr:hypothetical protein [Humitalea rosea]PZW39016.1 hypothetical protein C8P66_13149 [Humitalea rosea]